MARTFQSPFIEANSLSLNPLSPFSISSFSEEPGFILGWSHLVTRKFLGDLEKAERERKMVGNYPSSSPSFCMTWHQSTKDGNCFECKRGLESPRLGFNEGKSVFGCLCCCHWTRDRRLINSQASSVLWHWLLLGGRIRDPGRQADSTVLHNLDSRMSIM